MGYYMAFRDICKQKLRKNYGKMAKNQVFKLKMPLPSKQWVVGSIPARGATFLHRKKHEAVGFASCRVSGSSYPQDCFIRQSRASFSRRTTKHCSTSAPQYEATVLPLSHEVLAPRVRRCQAYVLRILCLSSMPEIFF